jgi:class 3 adenylate cyclase
MTALGHLATSGTPTDTSGRSSGIQVTDQNQTDAASRSHLRCSSSTSPPGASSRACSTDCSLDTAGDGLLATFDGPARAVRCATAIVAAVRTLGLEIRAGVHTGEIERAGSDIRGIAVHLGARIAALAEPGEVLVSSTVKDIVAGSGIGFDERGEHELKGVPGEWRLFAARD